jgi:hypothetical protein
MYDAFDPSRLTHATSTRSISPLPCLLLGSWSLQVLRCALTGLHSITSYQTQEQPRFRRLAHNPGSPRIFGRSKPAWTLFTTHNTRNSYPINRTGEMLPRQNSKVTMWNWYHSSHRLTHSRQGSGSLTPNHVSLAHSGRQTHTLWIFNRPPSKEHKASDPAFEPVHPHPELLHPDQGDDQDHWTRNDCANL